jgi:hypothetical protein
VKGGWRKLHNEELRDLYSSPSIIRLIRSRRKKWAGHAAPMGERRNACKLLVRKPEERRTQGRPRRRWVDNIRMNLGEIGLGGVAQGSNNRRARQCSNKPAGNLPYGYTPDGLSSAHLHTDS